MKLTLVIAAKRGLKGQLLMGSGVHRRRRPAALRSPSASAKTYYGVNDTVRSGLGFDSFG